MWSVIGRLRPSSSMSGQTNLEITNPYLYSSQLFTPLLLTHFFPARGMSLFIFLHPLQFYVASFFYHLLRSHSTKKSVENGKVGGRILH